MHDILLIFNWHDTGRKGDPVQRGTPVDVYQWKPLLDPDTTKFFVNTDFHPEEGAETLQKGLADAIVFGRSYIGNPDLAQRLIANQEVNT